MNGNDTPSNDKTTRRVFLKSTGTLAAGTVLAGSGIPKVHAAENNTIRVAIVGMGGRGKGAAMQALSADPRTVLWAVADAFENRVVGGVHSFEEQLRAKERSDQFAVPEERRFHGFDAYRKAMDTLNPGDVVLLATPPAFRPLHFEYAVEKGLHIFAEKPLAVDVPGLKRLREANAKAKEKGLKCAVGLNNRHYLRTEETVRALQDGRLGKLLAFWVYRMQGGGAPPPVGDMSPLEYQLRNLFNFTWTTGGFIVDGLIHNLDICCWAAGELPVAAQGQGGQLLRPPKDQRMDHGAVEYYFADGRRMQMYARSMPKVWNSFQAIIHGTNGSATLGEGVGEPKIFNDYNASAHRARKDAAWVAESPGNNSYQTEHDRLFKAIRENTPWNEIDRGIDATFTAILGRMSVESGQFVKAEDAWKSTVELVPNIDGLSFDGPFPLVPDENGNYARAIPGETPF